MFGLKRIKNLEANLEDAFGEIDNLMAKIDYLERRVLSEDEAVGEPLLKSNIFGEEERSAKRAAERAAAEAELG